MSMRGQIYICKYILNNVHMEYCTTFKFVSGEHLFNKMFMIGYVKQKKEK